MSMNNDWQVIAAHGELGEGEMKAFESTGKRLLLVFAEGRYYLVDEMCSHEDYSLALGCIKGTRIKCSLHGSYFDLDTGEALDEPADTPIRTYPVKLEDGQIWAKLS
jgi:3-phenylpropionate/trans-cinnamate dioxygenase ferredoxin subunit